MIVADANLLAYLVVAGEHTAEAESVFDLDTEWLAPPLWRSELRSVLRQHMSRGHLTAAKATAAFERADVVIGGLEREPDVRTVFELAERSKCTTYDCEYVALAAALGLVVVTADRALIKAFPDLALSPKAFLQSSR